MTSVTRMMDGSQRWGHSAPADGAVADSAAARRPSEMPAVVKGMVRGCYEMGGTTAVWASRSPIR